ncbi:MAG: hypothetical protein HY720_20185 [Planctomycetes bacterium]|nr:hypothetical protein [Planctomycetota bacterium]
MKVLPGVRRHDALPGGRILPAGGRVPIGRLPAGGWVPLGSWLHLEAQTPALPGEPRGKIRLAIVRAGAPTRDPGHGAERDPGLVVTPFARFAGWAERASAARLRPLVFAASCDGRALVRGHPLPPIPGERCCEEDGIAVPCGFAWSPRVGAGTVRAVLGLAPRELALFAGDGSWERVPGESFARAARSAVRATGEKLSRGL